MSIQQYIYSDTVFVVDAISKTHIFELISEKLSRLSLVKKDFLNHLIERETHYPTGLDLSPIHPDLPYIAIPHTESKFVNETRIIPIKLKQPISFQNMIAPTEDFDVSFLFLILNHNTEVQTNILAEIMDYLNQTNITQLQKLFNSDNAQEIFELLTNQEESSEDND